MENKSNYKHNMEYEKSGMCKVLRKIPDFPLRKIPDFAIPYHH